MIGHAVSASSQGALLAKAADPSLIAGNQFGSVRTQGKLVACVNKENGVGLRHNGGSAILQL